MASSERRHQETSSDLKTTIRRHEYDRGEERKGAVDTVSLRQTGDKAIETMTRVPGALRHHDVQPSLGCQTIKQYTIKHMCD